MRDVLSRNENGSINFECRLATSDSEPVTRVLLRKMWRELFSNFRGDIVFYFSGHGTPTDVGGYLVTQEGTVDDPGLAMDDVITLANNSHAETVLIILDCCFSGAAGNPAALQRGDGVGTALLREGVTIIAASRPGEEASEKGGHGVFTDLVVGALSGGGADVRGRVSAASVYAYAEAALGAWDQRPVYKSHAAHLSPVRLCKEKVSDALLRELPEYFPGPEDGYQLDMTYEESNGCAVAAHVDIFKKLKTLQIAGLVCPRSGTDLFWTAERSGQVELTHLGRFYHRLVMSSQL